MRDFPICQGVEWSLVFFCVRVYGSGLVLSRNNPFFYQADVQSILRSSMRAYLHQPIQWLGEKATLTSLHIKTKMAPKDVESQPGSK